VSLQAARLALFGLLATWPAALSAQKLYVDMTGAELARAVPELVSARLQPDQQPPEPLLRATGAELAKMLANLGPVSLRESIHELSFAGVDLRADQNEEYLYVAQPAKSGEIVSEYRTDARSSTPLAVPVREDVRVSGGFIAKLAFLLESNRARARFRYLGQDRETHLLAFASGAAQGLVWISGKSHAVERLRVEANEQSTDIVFQTADGGTAWLPARVTVDARQSDMAFHSVHRFNTGPAAKQAEDAWEMTARAIAAGDVELLRAAVRRAPGLAQARYHLAVALWKAGDVAQAESELHAAAESAPDLGPVHNLLGILSAKRNPEQAATEFRAAARLQPNDSVVQFNLGQVLEKLHDHDGALAAYRAAVTLDPGNARFKIRYEQLANKQPDEAPIRVDVRQVVVPAVVTDAEGHHIPGLTRADFQVFENDVEQQITAFSVESVAAGAAKPAAVVAAAETRAPPERKKMVRRTYLICLDTLHAEVGNLPRVRQALETMFMAEQSGDAQYIVMAVGRKVEILHNATTDPASVVKAIQGSNFAKLYQSGTRSERDAELARFRRELEDVQTACNNREPSCRVRRDQLPELADQLAKLEEAETATFLRQIGSLVEQLARAHDRRTVILFSDGFEMTPGRQVFDLLSSYFPEIRSAKLRTVARLQGALEPVLRLAANSNITIQTIDTRGLYTQDSLKAQNAATNARMAPALLQSMNQSASAAGGTLVEIAAATGGTAFQNSNDFLRGLQRAFSDGREYYMLAYTPSSPPPDGKFRTISVRLRKHEKLIVNAKRGYWP
jgi:VWFA-related protein